MLRDFTYIDDIVSGIEKLLVNVPEEDNNKARYEIYNIGNNKPVKLMYFIEILEHLLGKKAKKEFLPMQQGDVYQTFADISKLEHKVGFKPSTGIETGLSKFVKWYKEYY